MAGWVYQRDVMNSDPDGSKFLRYSNLWVTIKHFFQSTRIVGRKWIRSLCRLVPIA